MKKFLHWQSFLASAGPTDATDRRILFAASVALVRRRRLLVMKRCASIIAVTIAVVAMVLWQYAGRRTQLTESEYSHLADWTQLEQAEYTLASLCDIETQSYFAME